MVNPRILRKPMVSEKAPKVVSLPKVYVPDFTAEQALFADDDGNLMNDLDLAKKSTLYRSAVDMHLQQVEQKALHINAPDEVVADSISPRCLDGNELNMLADAALRELDSQSRKKMISYG